MTPTPHKLQVITVFPSGTRVKFNIEHKEFFDTLTRDTKRRIDLWLDADNDKPFGTYYKVTGVIFDTNKNKMDLVELTPIEMSGN